MDSAMAPSRILDSHIHLWPGTATTSKHHGWMSEGHFFAKQHGIQDYLAVATPKPWGFIYVETDRYLPSPTPPLHGTENEAEQEERLENWAQQPLEELRFLRRIVEDKAQEGDGFQEGDVELMKGCVIWAPFPLAPALFKTFLRIAEGVAGPELWRRVVGFRYLLQGKAEGEVKRIVQSEAWIENMTSLASGREGKGWAFDVGVDTHRDGLEPLEAVGEMIQEVRRREKASGSGKAVRFVLSRFEISLIVLYTPRRCASWPMLPAFSTSALHLVCCCCCCCGYHALQRVNRHTTSESEATLQNDVAP
ncbi:hypothetical protein LEMA_P091430.1 [Plenodomus lingam JN3]|uniref:Amidohydrolase-related domain-containing protein n=1 Tax=Leptosphaeria maculans (strain JN3 / isolate v23.1.3 / race Av1-4-5-6-7-8) TaxID=985895 RepID=E5A217_LEPMJ|nr:hypothetical protein LEMA_P091430.1 [Plenodomus lingam JN3]CBX97734.1 hypothetical protein LEMA_P091430.1 [Plenodomus lingam JN3]